MPLNIFMKLIKRLTGYSNSNIVLMENSGELFVRKYGDIERNLERYENIKTLVRVPQILRIEPNYYDMEYIFGIDIKNYLRQFNTDKLIKFLEKLLHSLSKNTTPYDYRSIYESKLVNFDFAKHNFIFDKNSFLGVLPTKLPRSQYIGDLSLDNIIYSIKEDCFVLIDPLTSVYDSYVFDIAKLRQDTVCRWFIRDHTNQFHTELEILSKNFTCHNSLTILMLMRILPYSKNQTDRDYLTNEINKLWNSM